jgi:hypothetical protein
MGSAFVNGWISLPTQGEIYMENGLPRHVWVPHGPVDLARLTDEIAQVTGLNTRVGEWQEGVQVGEMEASLDIDAEDIDQVLQRLARVSAETFYERYHKAIDDEDIDFDDEAYSQDLNAALTYCRLDWSQINQRELRSSYRRALHQASAALAAE